MTTKHMHEHVKLDIQCGAVKIDNTRGLHRSGDSAVIDLSTETKYPHVLSWGDDDGVPHVMLSASERTLNVDTTRPRSDVTVVRFPDHAGFRVVAADAGRRTVVVTLHRELPEEEESTDPQALPSAHPWVIGSKEFSDDAARQADFLAGAKHAGLGFEMINSRHATIAWQEEANRLLVGMFKEDEAAVRSMWAQDLKRHLDIPPWMVAKGYTGPVKVSS